MGNPLKKIVASFFEQYEVGANTFNVDIITSEFTDDFLAADPSGVFAGKNNDEFRKAIPERQKQFAAIGFQEAQILSVDQDVLDDHYVKAKVHWEMKFLKAEELISAKFYITYFLFVKDEQAKIAFYISHESEEETMKSLGLLQ